MIFEEEVDLNLTKFGNIERAFVVNEPYTLKKYLNAEELNVLTHYIVHYSLLDSFEEIVKHNFLQDIKCTLCFLHDFKAMNRHEYAILVKKIRFMTEEYNNMVILILNAVMFNTTVFFLKKDVKHDLFQEIYDIKDIKIEEEESDSIQL